MKGQRWEARPTAGREAGSREMGVWERSPHRQCCGPRKSGVQRHVARAMQGGRRRRHPVQKGGDKGGAAAGPAWMARRAKGVQRVLRESAGEGPAGLQAEQG